MRLYLSRKFGRDAHLRTVAGLPGTVLLPAAGTSVGAQGGVAESGLVAPSAAAAAAAESDPLVREAAIRAARDRLPVALKNRFDRDMLHASLVHGFWPPMPRVRPRRVATSSSTCMGGHGTAAAVGAAAGSGADEGPASTPAPSSPSPSLAAVQEGVKGETAASGAGVGSAPSACAVEAVSEHDAFKVWLGLPGVPPGALVLGLPW